MMRPLGAFTDKAWIAGWDAGVCGFTELKNPYRRPEQRSAWERGRQAGIRSTPADVLMLKRKLAERAA